MDKWTSRLTRVAHLPTGLDQHQILPFGSTRNDEGPSGPPALVPDYSSRIDLARLADRRSSRSATSVTYSKV